MSGKREYTNCENQGIAVRSCPAARPAEPIRRAPGPPDAPTGRRDPGASPGVRPGGRDGSKRAPATEVDGTGWVSMAG